MRWSFWVRMAVLGIATGEMSTSSGCNFNFRGWPQSHPRQDQLLATAIDPHLLMALPILIGSALILMLLWMYVGSVCRFVLFEAVLNGHVTIHEAWTRWKDQGARFFGFQVIMLILLMVAIGIIVGMLVLTIGVAALRNSAGGGFAALGGVILALLAMFIVMVPYLVVFVLAKDFAVPVMALEGATFNEGWRRVWAMVKSEPGSVAGYIGMKIVLAIAAGIMLGITLVIILLILAIPVGGLGFLAFMGLKGAWAGWNLYTITGAIVLGTIAISAIIFLIAFVSAPVTTFFPAYALYFFAGRYQPLHDRLFPPQPPTAVVEPTPVPEPPPEPITS